MRPLVLLALAASLSLVGCLEEERTITLEPDGRGTLRLVRTLSKGPSGMVLRLDMDRAALARRFAAEQLAEIQGVVLMATRWTRRKVSSMEGTESLDSMPLRHLGRAEHGRVPGASRPHFCSSVTFVELRDLRVQLLGPSDHINWLRRSRARGARSR